MLEEADEDDADLLLLLRSIIIIITIHPFRPPRPRRRSGTAELSPNKPEPVATPVRQIGNPKVVHWSWSRG